MLVLEWDERRIFSYLLQDIDLLTNAGQVLLPAPPVPSHDQPVLVNRTILPKSRYTGAGRQSESFKRASPTADSWRRMPFEWLAKRVFDAEWVA